MLGLETTRIYFIFDKSTGMIRTVLISGETIVGHTIFRYLSIFFNRKKKPG